MNVTSPANGATVSGTFNISAAASDAGGIQRVRFYVDGAYYGFDTTAPYARGWNSATVANGSHTLMVQAVDNAGNAATSSVTVTVSNADGVAPIAAVTGPANGATISGVINLSATASDNVGVVKVRFYIDGVYFNFDSTSPYARGWNSATVANGPHTVSVQAVDLAGNLSILSTVNITVSN